VVYQIVEINELGIFVESLPSFLSNPQTISQILVAVLMLTVPVVQNLFIIFLDVVSMNVFSAIE
jgi:hypothetical protein